MTRIGKYNIVAQIGEGAMGIVYKAVDPMLNRPVAIKVMSEGLAQDEGLRQRFLREAQAAGSLQHPNLVTIYDFGETDGHLYIAMEYIEGTDLEELLRRHVEMPLPAKLELMIDVLNGLSFAHRRGIVHRDIKPANIRIDTEGHARIMDFGVVHLSTSNLTGTGIMMGTPNYMAPEQITSGEVTPAADLFSAGAVLFELLTNAKPFEADTLHRVLFRIVSDPAPDLLELAPDLPPALARVVAKALAKDVRERYANATEMANDLSAIRASLGAPRASRTVSQRSSIERALLVQRQSQNSAALRRWKVASGVAASLFVVAAAGFVVMTRMRNPATAADTPAVTVAGAPSAAAKASVATDSTASTAALPPPTPAPSREPPPPAPTQASVTQRANSTTRELVAPPRRDTQRTAGARRDTARAVAAAPPRQDSTPVRTDAPAVSPVTSTPPEAAPIQQVTTPPVSSLSAADSATRPASQQSAGGVAASPAVSAAPDNPRAAITALMATYARAIGTRSVAQVKQVYAGMTPAQESGWQSFFGSVRSMTASFDIQSLDVTGSTAVAQMTGAYEFVTRAGRTERQPASFEAAFRREGDRWRLQTIR